MDVLSTGGRSTSRCALGEAVSVLGVAAAVAPGFEAVVEDVVPAAAAGVVETFSVAGLTVTGISGWTKTTVSEPVLASPWTCTSATNA